MADVIEVPPPAMDVSGNSTIVWVPGATRPATAVAVKAGKRVTYSFTSTGWQPTFEQAIDADPRFTLKQQLQSFGLKTNGLTLTYVDSTDSTSAAVLLTEGLSGFFVERRGVPNQQDFAAGDKVRVYPVTLGQQTPVTAETGKETILQSTILTGVVGNPVALT